MEVDSPCKLILSNYSCNDWSALGLAEIKFSTVSAGTVESFISGTVESFISANPMALHQSLRLKFESIITTNYYTCRCGHIWSLHWVLHLSSRSAFIISQFHFCRLILCNWKSIGSKFLLIASGTIRSSVRATPPKLKPHPITSLIMHLDYTEFTPNFTHTERMTKSL